MYYCYETTKERFIKYLDFTCTKMKRYALLGLFMYALSGASVANADVYDDVLKQIARPTDVQVRMDKQVDNRSHELEDRVSGILSTVDPSMKDTCDVIDKLYDRAKDKYPMKAWDTNPGLKAIQDYKDICTPDDRQFDGASSGDTDIVF